MAEDEFIGETGVLLVGTRAQRKPGEVRLRHRGGHENFIAISDEPIAAGRQVLVLAWVGNRTVEVTDWSDPMAAPTDL